MSDVSPGDMYQFDADNKRFGFVYDLIIHVDDEFVHVLQCYKYTADVQVKYTFWKRTRHASEPLYNTKSKWIKL